MKAYARSVSIAPDDDKLDFGIDGSVRRVARSPFFDVELQLVCDEEFARKLLQWVEGEGVDVGHQPLLTAGVVEGTFEDE